MPVAWTEVMLNGPTELGNPGNLKPKASRLVRVICSPKEPLRLGSKVTQSLKPLGPRLGSRLSAEEDAEVVLQAAVESVDDGEVDDVASSMALGDRS